MRLLPPSSVLRCTYIMHFCLSTCRAFLGHAPKSKQIIFSSTSTIQRSAIIVRSTVAPITSPSLSPLETKASSFLASSETNHRSYPTSKSSNSLTWESKQHLYGLDMVQEEEEKASSINNSRMSVTLGVNGEQIKASSSKTVGVEATQSGEPLPLPQTYITCGKCNSLFAIAEEDLGRGKGCRVKCTVCSNTWYQSRDRLFDIPTETHDMIPAHKSDLDRIARNLAHNFPPNFMGVNKLYVGNLDFQTTSEQLLDFFESQSEKPNVVCDVSMVKGPDGRSRGFAFVTFYDEADGKAALECNGLVCNGRELSVKEPNN